ncbi:DEAD/DEAH box helicase [Methanoplanus endosymbiosus]|uniref:DEAD/DEAH box helicase n=1 Tax=Methanoplanus endosymbiosus TaxID=33865 RepID=A0A9E7PPE7_9EURY|nr:DEAD/DEAH box helicase [Methanoplanus endosymbiosus]UUX92634.1 DEAD/DEAH box helicase [Methanoplanus endosymbiosus]
MSQNPLIINSEISKRYINYLKTTFQISDSDIRNKFWEELGNKDLIKGPILEITPPFKNGRSIQELVKEDNFPKSLMNLNQDEIPAARNLYLHQEKALLRSINDKRNIVVATGTGSGKTEIFMLTILNKLFREKEQNKLSPGVRALILYPMNALVNDQLKRMRKLLKNNPEITFGRYTGETKERRSDALQNYHDLYGHNPIENELISREEMRENPPHILLTNYAMLEYLLLRPKDNVFFDGDNSENWKFIVLDEAHTYNGAKGIEIAMLLRRVKERVVQSEKGKIQCIATSATLGGGKEDYGKVAEFASNLFGEEFTEEDIISAERRETFFDNTWGFPNEDLYVIWKNILDSEDENIIEQLSDSGIKHGIPENIIKRSKSKSNNTDSFLYTVLSGDERILKIKKELSENPADIETCAEKYFPDSAENKEYLVALVEISSRAKREGSDPLLPSRYHLFVRSVEGAFIQFQPELKISLEPKKTDFIEKNNCNYPVFELGVCRYCGSPYLIGKIKKENDFRYVLEQSINPFSEDDNKVEYFLINKEITNEDNDEEDEILLNKNLQQKREKYKLCGKCGAINKASIKVNICNCGNEYLISLYKINGKEGKLHKCPVCLKLNPADSVVGRFLTGRDAVPGVIASAIYQKLPEIPVNNDTYDTEDGDWSFSKKETVSKYKRNLLIFSDSRQDAAFFAPYLNQTYNKILRRSLIVSVLKENFKLIYKNQWRITDLIDPLLAKINQLNFKFDETGNSNLARQEKINLIKKWLFYEFSFSGNMGNLEDLGICSFTLIKPENWVAPPPLLREPWNLSEDEVWSLVSILFENFRSIGAIKYPDGIDPEDEFFRPKNYQFYFRQFESDRYQHINSWIPKEKYSNRRLDFLIRLVKKINPKISKNDCVELLNNIWKNIVTNHVFSDYFILADAGQNIPAYLMKPDKWIIRTNYSEDDLKWYYCDECHTLTLTNLRSVCPQYRCNGKLIPVNPSQLFSDNHYRLLYEEWDTIPMKASEHTAQLNNDEASNIQQKFIQGDINILSCSTTFELGVDVGELESVFMRNMPPSSANYIQRAGRAGRRLNSNAFVTTFCQRRSHDLTYFRDPMPFVKGIISPPLCEIHNEKIVKRHIYSTALAEFWKYNPNYFSDVKTFFIDNDIPEKFRKFLVNRPEMLEQSLRRIVPEGLHEITGIEKWNFIDDLYSNGENCEFEGLITRAKNIIESDIKDIDNLHSERTNNQKSADYLLRLKNTLLKQQIISYLSTNNILPKYGFPVDVVELKLPLEYETAKKFELQRDLRIAISEYAPGSQIVAGGYIWESRYIKKNPKKEWLIYDYAICDNCHRYHRVLHGTGKCLDFCESCKQDLRSAKKCKQFLKPQYGFVSENKAPNRNIYKRPKKTYSSRIYYSGESKPERNIKLTGKSGINLFAESATQGQLAVINNAGSKGFLVCPWCGYTIIDENGKWPKTHKNSYGNICKGKPRRELSLGHEFLTDILILDFRGYSSYDNEMWKSLLYGLIEGLCSELDISRDDIDGTLYPIRGKNDEPAIVIFDNVPGGAGHVRRAISDKETLKAIIRASYNNVKNCSCGGIKGEASCYGCLRTYSNQFCHEQLDRKKVVDFFEEIFPEFIS